MMDLERIFSLCSLLALAGWIALLAAPLSRVPLIRAARVTSGALALTYLIQLFTITQPVQGGSFSTLAGVSALFSMPGNVMLGWTHFLAFDLFIGSWEAEDAAASGVPHWLLIPCLGLTLMFGPIGLLLYFFIRTVKIRFF